MRRPGWRRACPPRRRMGILSSSSTQAAPYPSRVADAERFGRGAGRPRAGATGGASNDTNDTNARATRGLAEWVGEHAPDPSRPSPPPDPAVEPVALVVPVDT